MRSRQTGIQKHIEQPDNDGVPARFEAWPEDIKERAYELWSTIANRSAPRAERLLAQELGDHVAVPAASTIRQWAREGAWASRANVELEHSHGRTVYELRVTLLQGLKVAQDVLISGMTGEFDGDPRAGMVRVKSAEIVLKAAADARVFDSVGMSPESEESELEELDELDPFKRAAQNRRLNLREKERAGMLRRR